MTYRQIGLSAAFPRYWQPGCLVAGITAARRIERFPKDAIGLCVSGVIESGLALMLIALVALWSAKYRLGARWRCIWALTEE